MVKIWEIIPWQLEEVDVIYLQEDLEVSLNNLFKEGFNNLVNKLKNL